MYKRQIYYCASGSRYENDWMRFDSDEDFVSSLPVQGVPFPLPDAEYCHNLIQLLTWKNSFPGRNNERVVEQLLQLLFSELQEASQSSADSFSQSPHYHDLMNLRKAVYNSPQLPWNVSGMAQQLYLSEGYLQVIYKNTFGISCMEDVYKRQPIHNLCMAMPIHSARTAGICRPLSTDILFSPVPAEYR